MPSTIARRFVLQRCRPVVAAGAGLLLSVAAASAQTSMDKRTGVNQMLDALKAAPDGETAAALESRLENAWLHAGTPAVTLLMSKGLRLLNAGETDGAVDSFSDAITLQPDDAEAWHQRAIARYHAGDVTGAVTDLEQTVRLEPRDFAAYRTLTDIAEQRADWKAAYAAWQKVMQLDPKTQGGEERLQVLKRKALGEET